MLDPLKELSTMVNRVQTYSHAWTYYQLITIIIYDEFEFDKIFTLFPYY